MNINDFIDYFNNNVKPNFKRRFSRKGLKELWTGSYITGIVLILVGLLFIFLPMIVSGSLGIIAGLLMIAYGVISFIGCFVSPSIGFGREFRVIKSVFLVVVGVIFIAYPMTLMSIITFFIGMFFLIDGFIKVRGMYAIPKRRTISWWITFILSALVAALGLFVIIFPFRGIEAILTISGVLMCVSGLQKIVDSWRNRRFL